MLAQRQQYLTERGMLFELSVLILINLTLTEAENIPILS